MFSPFWPNLPFLGANSTSHFLAQAFLEIRVFRIIRVFRALHWFSSISGAREYGCVDNIFMNLVFGQTWHASNKLL